MDAHSATVGPPAEPAMSAAARSGAHRQPRRAPARAAHLRLLAAAEAVGATVLVMVPPASLRPTRRPTPPTDTPPRAA